MVTWRRLYRRWPERTLRRTGRPAAPIVVPCADGSPSSGRPRRSPGSSRRRTSRPTTGRALQRRPHGRGGGRRPARRSTGRRPVSLGPRALVGRDPRRRPRRSTPGRSPSRPAGCSATRSGAGAASCRWTASTSGCGSTAARQPMRILDPADEPLALAGLWTGPPRRRVGRVAADVHDRDHAARTRSWPRSTTGCRSSIPRASWATWLDPTPREPGELRALLEPRDDVALDAYPVSSLVNSVRNNGPGADRAPVEASAAVAAAAPAASGDGREAPSSAPAASRRSRRRNAVAGSRPASSPSA